MKKVLPIAGNKFPQKTFAVLAVVALVAFLLTFKAVAEVVKTGVEKLGITFPPLDVFRNVAQQINYLALGVMFLLLGLVIGLVGLKVAVVLIAVASIYYAGMAIYNSLVKGVTKDVLPEDVPKENPKGNQNNDPYMDAYMGGPIYSGGKK